MLVGRSRGEPCRAPGEIRGWPVVGRCCLVPFACFSLLVLPCLPRRHCLLPVAAATGARVGPPWHMAHRCCIAALPRYSNFATSSLAALIVTKQGLVEPVQVPAPVLQVRAEPLLGVAVTSTSVPA